MSYGAVKSTSSPSGDSDMPQQNPASPVLSNTEATAETGADLHATENGRPWKSRLVAFYEKNIGLVFVSVAQLFASIVSIELIYLLKGHHDHFFY